MTDYICTHCSYVGKRKKVMRGSRGMEIFLWTILFFPGPVYTIWRLMTKRYGCPQCGAHVMVPVISKEGRLKEEELNADISPEALKAIPDMWREDREEYARKHGLYKTEEKPKVTGIEQKLVVIESEQKPEHQKPKADEW
jgi:hypothetical protein